MCLLPAAPFYRTPADLMKSVRVPSPRDSSPRGDLAVIKVVTSGNENFELKKRRSIDQREVPHAEIN